jgi:CRISPR-associated protein Csm3
MRHIAHAFRLLQVDYLGGHGTRGSGRVSFEEITLSAAEGEMEPGLRGEIESMFKEVESYELMSV